MSQTATEPFHSTDLTDLRASGRVTHSEAQLAVTASVCQSKVVRSPSIIC